MTEETDLASWKTRTLKDLFWFAMRTCSGWTAAMEALTAFVKSYVVPNLMQSDGAILLQPILGYLTGYFSAF